jgi:hypothetical protein
VTRRTIRGAFAVPARSRAAPRIVVLALSLLAGRAFAAAVVVESGRFGNTFVAGEVPALSVRVTADADRPVRGTLRVVAKDAYGAAAGRARFAVDLPPARIGAWPFTITTRRLGHFTIEAALVGDGSRVRGTASAGIVPPVDDSDAGDSGVGYYVLPFPEELPRAEAIAVQMRQFGIRWVRLAYNWLDDARRVRPDVADPAWLDTEDLERWVDVFRAQGIEVLCVLFGTARWASSQPDNETVDNTVIPYPVWALVAPGDPADWQRLVRTLAERLRGRVRNWELWNEPDIFYFWRSSPREFATLTLATAAAVRAVDPDARLVLNFVDQDTPASAAFQAEVLAVAGHELDVFGWHYGSLESIEAARALVPRLRPGASVWNTEAYGVPRRLISRWLQQRAAGVERLFPFVYHIPVDDALLGLIRHGLYPVNVDYTPRPDAIALRTLSDLVGSATPIAGGPVGRGFSAYHFAASGGNVTALVDGNDPGLTWMPESASILRVAVPAGVRRLETIDLMGNRRLQRVRGGRLRVAMLGVATFLRAGGGAPLTGLRVVGSRARPG